MSKELSEVNKARRLAGLLPLTESQAETVSKQVNAARRLAGLLPLKEEVEVNWRSVFHQAMVHETNGTRALVRAKQGQRFSLFYFCVDTPAKLETVVAHDDDGDEMFALGPKGTVLIDFKPEQVEMADWHEIEEFSLAHLDFPVDRQATEEPYSQENIAEYCLKIKRALGKA